VSIQDNSDFLFYALRRHHDLLFLALSGSLLFLWPQLSPNILASDRFMPHGICYLWIRELVNLHFSADLPIAISDAAISATLAFLVLG
jgi:hypothetical protein